MNNLKSPAERKVINMRKTGISGNKLISNSKKELCETVSESICPSKELSDLIRNGAFILDVRSLTESGEKILPKTLNIPLHGLKQHLDELPHYKTIITYCCNGELAGKAKDILTASGFNAVNGGSYKRMKVILGKD